MKLKIFYNLWKARRSSEPSLLFKSDLWRKLEKSLPREIPFWYQQVWFKWSVVGAACLLVVSSFGTGVYAYNSPEVTENTPLYFIKQAMEKIEGVTKITPIAKEKFIQKEITRREAEKKVMEKRGQALKKAEERINNLEDRLKTEKDNLHNRKDYILEKNKVEDKKSEKSVPDREKRSENNDRNKK